MVLKEIIKHLEQWAPPILQESYDNSGLYCGNPDDEIQGVLVSLDITSEVVEEAIRKGLNLIVAHHPLIFKPLKSMVVKDDVTRALHLAIINNIALYGIHTNLDNVLHGVNGFVAQKMGLRNVQILAPGRDSLVKLVVFVPHKHAEAVQSAMFQAGAGHIGNYSECSFMLAGSGTFKPNAVAQPFVGEEGKRHIEPETRLEMILPHRLLSATLSAMHQAHPYEEVAYDVYPLSNDDPTTGAGIIGELQEEQSVCDFLYQLKKIFELPYIKCTKKMPEKVKRIAFCGGSGAFLINQAKRSGAQLYISADIKYHEFFAADSSFGIVDLGHYESEQFTIELISKHLNEKLITFASQKTEVNTNPVIIF